MRTGKERVISRAGGIDGDSGGGSKAKVETRWISIDIQVPLDVIYQMFFAMRLSRPELHVWGDERGTMTSTQKQKNNKNF